MDKRFTVVGDSVRIVVVDESERIYLSLSIAVCLGNVRIETNCIKFQHLGKMSFILDLIDISIEEMKENGRFAAPDMTRELIKFGFNYDPHIGMLSQCI